MRRRDILFSFSFLLACGGPQQPTKEVTTLPSASASSAPAAPVVDLSPVAMPQSVVVVMHAPHVGSTADMISEWAGQPLELDRTLGEMIGERFAKLVDVDAPAELTVALEDRGGKREPDLRVAVAFGVKDFEGTKTLLQGEGVLLSIGNGAFEIKRSGHHRREGDSDFRSCALAPAPSGGKIVCARDATARDEVLPYLTRGVAGFAANKSDVHVEARPGPLRELVRRERADITQGGARWMGRDVRPLAEAVITDLCDGFLETERASFDASIDAKQGTIDFKISAKGSQALVTRILTAHPERAEAPPAIFLRIPEDADVALFERGLDADQIAGPRAQFATWLENGMASEPKFSAADRKAVVDAATHTIDLAAMPMVYARGVDFAKAVPAVAGLTESSDASKIRAGIEQAAGWDVLGVEGPPDKIAAVLKEWATTFARPTFTKEIKETKWRAATAPRNAPHGTTAFALVRENDDTDWNTRMPDGKYKKRPPMVLTMHTLVVPDGTRAWIVNALDEATAVNVARKLVGSASGGTLATRAGLDLLRSAHANLGGFITPRAAGLGMPITWLSGWNLRYKIANDPLVGVTSQSQYTTPIVFFAQESAQGDDKSLAVGARVTRAVVADVLAVGPRIFH